tara:strand:+ start:486 stop:941 length:456 start_codon:yes stop_codon:yes gene_type:complete
MARRAKRKTRRRRKQGVSILGLAETYMLTSVATKTLFNVDALEFVLGNPSNPKGVWGYTQGPNKIGLRELFSMKQYTSVTGTAKNYSLQGGASYPTTKIIKENLQENAASGIAGMILIPLGFRLGKNLARPAITRANKLLNDVGIGRTIKV